MAISFQKAEALWNKRRGESKHLRPELGSSKGARARLHKHDGYFTVKLYSTDVVEIHPEHYVLHTGGWETMLTAEVMWRVAGVRAYLQTVKCRESSFRIAGYPHFPGIRVSRIGIVFPEDRRKDVFTRPSKEGVQDYANLFRWLKRTLAVRWELGEFEDWDDAHTLTGRDLIDLNTLRLGGEKFPPHDLAIRLVRAATGKFERVAQVQNDLRHRYHELNANYVTTEE